MAKKSASTQSAAQVPTQAPLPADDVIIRKVDDLDLGAFFGKLATARTAIEAVFGKIGDGVMSEARTYAELQRAIEVKRQELSSLYGQEQALKTLDELTSIIDQIKLDWEAQKSQNARNRAEDEQNWKFGFAQRKAQEEAGYQAMKEKRDREREEKEYQDNLDRQRRLAILKEAEGELTELRQLKEKLDEKIDKEVQEALAEQQEKMQQAFDHQVEITALNHKSEISRIAAERGSLANQLLAANNEIAILRKQLEDAAKRESQTMAAAFAAQSSSQALKELQQALATTGTGPRKG